MSLLPLPRFSWSPSCGMSSLVVVEVTDPTSSFLPVMWGFTVPEVDPMGPGIVYGSAPGDADTWAGPVGLVGGKTYRVTVEYTVGGDVRAAGGIAEFTWYPRNPPGIP